VLTGFSSHRIEANGVEINVVRGGEGPPVLLLHGYPQTHVMWHRVAPRLAQDHTVVCPDLRGYGDSEKPSGGAGHDAYSKRTMALDQLAVMRDLGFERFAVVGHDRGARVALRMTLDHRDAVERLAILDIVPTRTIYETIDQRRATTVWRYFFLIQPSPLPERLIAADPRFYLEWTLSEWSGDRSLLEDAAVDEYRRCFDQATLAATCEDYRAGATVDLQHDEADISTRLECPVLVMWSRDGLGASYDVLDIWRRRGSDVRGRPLDCGHFLAEERPDDVVRALSGFLAEASPS
jgi:haloacetate dehalogenase